MKILKIAIFVGTLYFGISNFALATSYSYPDLAGEANIINFEDFAVFASNWQKTGDHLAGDFDDNNSVDVDDLSYFSYYWLAEHWECDRIDIDSSGMIDFSDFVIFADCWLTDIGSPNYKSNCDFDGDGQINIYDLRAFSDCWLNGARPADIWEQFKATLVAGNTDTALTFIAENSKSRYCQIFQALGSNLPNYAAGIGALTLQSQDEGETVYEMNHQDDSITYSFPVLFIKDDDGIWRIYNF